MLPREQAAPDRLGRKGPWAAAFLISVIALTTAPARATTVRRLSLADVVGVSDAIVQGRIESAHSFWLGKQILTQFDIGVSGVLKGPKTDRIAFLQLGGRVDSPVPVQMTVPGSPILRIGDEAYFFLQPGKPGEHVIVGLFQGHVPLRHDTQGDFVVFGGERKSPAQFEGEVRRQMAGQTQDPTRPIQ